MTNEKLLPLNIVRSKLDATVKYVFLSRGEIVEFSFIDKDDGKDIICVPTQTACRLGCKFCYLSDYELKVRNLAAREIAEHVDHVIKDLGLEWRLDRNRVLLVSYMGCGEPLLNVTGTIAAATLLRERHWTAYETIRFAVASLIPRLDRMREFTEAVAREKLQLKFHLSLHSPDDAVRKELMPGSSPIGPSLDLVDKFRDRTGNAAEIHYSLIAGVNDRDEDLSGLVALLRGRGISVKFLMYNEKPSAAFQESKRVAEFRNALESAGIATEHYRPPGWDIGSSCGQFLMDYYAKYNRKK